MGEVEGEALAELIYFMSKGETGVLVVGVVVFKVGRGVSTSWPTDASCKAEEILDKAPSEKQLGFSSAREIQHRSRTHEWWLDLGRWEGG